MNKHLLLDLLKLALLFGVIWAIFIYFPIFPDKSNFEFSYENEDKLGNLIIEEILENSPGFSELSNPVLDSAFQKISSLLIDNIGLTEYDYRIRVIDNEQINAFTLPGGNIFVFSGLINFSENPEEVAAVLSHEIGHVEKRHVVSKLVKEFGLTLLFSILAGGDAVFLGELGKTVVSSVFDRKQEKEADQYGLELLVKSRISPTAMASFFRRVKRELGGYDESLEILMTHPHYNSRIKSSIEYKIPDGFSAQDLEIDWDRVKASLN
ncbi:MAG TPA: M48 family metallopeptidase [Flavobacteriales bacterium]|nr:M48 family metallopeptidase [Flavobacteriales bacterium]HIN39812.1 M48 family metallopeptidase [Flavobacteriales bacterium]